MLANAEQYYLQSKQKQQKHLFLFAAIAIFLVSSLVYADKENAGSFAAGIKQLFVFPSQLVPDVFSQAEIDDGAYSRNYLISDNLFSGVDTKGSILWWGRNLPEYLLLALETLSIALAATIVGSLFGMVLSWFASKSTAPTGGKTVYLVRRTAEFFRAFPELILALFFVYAFGLGLLPAFLAITIHTIGAETKLFSEVNDNSNPKDIKGIVAVGGNWWHQMCFGLLPQVMPNYLSYMLLRLEINVRGSLILGYVGAGGLGQQFRYVFSMNQFNQIALIILIIIGMILCIDAVSKYCRKKITH